MSVVFESHIVLFGLVERSVSQSGRIARGKIEDLTSLSHNVAGFDALILPGGYGTAKNLSDFAFTEGEYKVIPQVEEYALD